MPVVIVKTLQGVKAEQKQLLVKRITDDMEEVLGKNPETTHVIIEEYSEENWGLRGKTIDQIHRGK